MYAVKVPALQNFACYVMTCKSEGLDRFRSVTNCASRHLFYADYTQSTSLPQAEQIELTFDTILINVASISITLTVF